jgi:hypothetical protein
MISRRPIQGRNKASDPRFNGEEDAKSRKRNEVYPDSGGLPHMKVMNTGLETAGTTP